MDQKQDYQKVLDDYAKLTSTEASPPPPPTPIVPPTTSPPPSSPTPILPAEVPPAIKPSFDIFKYTFILSLLIFLGVLGTLGYNFYQQYLGKSGTSTPPPSPTSAPASTATPTSTAVCQLNDQSYHLGESFPSADGCNTCTCGPDLTITCTELDCSSPTIPPDWKTYENNLFSLSYPSDWQEENAGPDLTFFPKSDPSLRIYFSTKTNKTDLQKYSAGDIPIKTIIGGISGEKLTYQTPFKENQTYIQIKKGNIYLLISHKDTSDSSYSKVYDQILSTFKFTDNKEPISWVTISYPRYNVTFRIPKGWYFSNDALNGNYQQMTKDASINSSYNLVFITNDLKSESLLTISFEPSLPKKYEITKKGNLPEFDQILSSLKIL